MPSLLTRAAYHAQQASLRFPLLAAHAGLRLATARGNEPTAEDLRALQRAYFALLEKDLRNAEAGLYPRSLLFQIPLRSYARKLPRLLSDLPRTYLRFRRRDYRDLPADVDAERYPAYFRRTFHWQTDGYLSRRSAELYDLSVEFLFLGCADVMRRQVIPPLTRFARRTRGRRLRILDVGCGTGRTLRQIATALPGHQYFGVDLSPFYLEAARKELADVAEVTLLAENAEKLPFRDGYFDAVTSVYLFHELPRKARRRVAQEMARVLRPGGALVVEDSAQLAEARDLAFFLDGFAADMHEPFYRDYVRDDLAGILAEAGLEVSPAERCWLAKVVRATAPTSA
ncbi:MAG: class I SAM-dependent methyltransferase [Deltaproteobacteria bacterium]|nr:MAG: class I SAM-dependent methyltransferase [Deltaproteobacteria bacterium]